MNRAKRFSIESGGGRGFGLFLYLNRYVGFEKGCAVAIGCHLWKYTITFDIVRYGSDWRKTGVFRFWP